MKNWKNFFLPANKRLFIFFSLIALGTLFFLLFVQDEERERRVLIGPEKEKSAVTEVANTIPCPDLEQLIAQLNNQRPSWNELNCYLQKLKRFPISSRNQRIIIGARTFGQRPDIPQLYFNLSAQVYRQFSVNVSSLLFPFAPPYIDSQGDNLSYPLDAQALDEKLRAFSVMAIKEKQRGKLLIFVNDYPPQNGIPAAKNSAEFRAWVLQKQVPEKKKEAQIAEKLKAEFFVPFPLEIERIFSPSYQPYLNRNLPSQDLLALAQWYIDTIANAVRPLFKGRLVLPRYPFQSLPSLEKSPEMDWHDLKMKGFDQVNFSLIPECDEKTTLKFAQQQFSYYAQLAREQQIPWGLGELDLWRKHYEKCGVNFEEKEALLWTKLLDLLRQQNPPPVYLALGLDEDVDPTKTNPPTLKVIQDWLLNPD